MNHRAVRSIWYGTLVALINLTLATKNHACLPVIEHINQCLHEAYRTALNHAQGSAEQQALTDAQNNFLLQLKKTPLSAADSIALGHYIKALEHGAFGLPRLSPSASTLAAAIKSFKKRLGAQWIPFLGWAHHELMN